LITTIQIKTERTSRFTLKPVAVGHADGGTSFVGQDGGPIVLPLDYAVPLHLVFLLSGHVISGNGCKTNLDQHSKL
jgi:hypothetical protein